MVESVYSAQDSVLVRPSAPSPAEDVWPSRIVTEPLFNSPVSPTRRSAHPSARVRLLSTIGDLLDANLLSEPEVASLFELAFRGHKEAGKLADLVDARSSMVGKAQFLRIFLSVAGMHPSGFTTPAPMSYIHPTPFVDLPSPMLRSASPPMRFPLAVRPLSAAGGCQTLTCIQEDLMRMQSVEEDPKLSPGSTNVGSSIDSTVSPPGVALGIKGGHVSVCENVPCRE